MVNSKSAFVFVLPWFGFSVMLLFSSTFLLKTKRRVFTPYRPCRFFQTANPRLVSYVCLIPKFFFSVSLWALVPLFRCVKSSLIVSISICRVASFLGFFRFPSSHACSVPPFLLDPCSVFFVIQGTAFQIKFFPNRLVLPVRFCVISFFFRPLSVWFCSPTRRWPGWDNSTFTIYLDWFPRRSSLWIGSPNSGVLFFSPGWPGNGSYRFSLTTKPNTLFSNW